MTERITEVTVTAELGVDTTVQHERDASVPDTLAVASDGVLDGVVVFRLGEQHYALPMRSVLEIQQIVALSEVPGGGPGVLGMVNLRGHVIPVIDLRELLGLESVPATLQTPMLFCRLRGQAAALVVDEVLDVLQIPDGALQAASPMHALSRRLVGVCRLDDGPAYLFDPDLLVPAATLDAACEAGE